MNTIPLKEKLTDYLMMRKALGFTTSRSKLILESLVEYLERNVEKTSIPGQVSIDWACNSSARSGIPGQFSRLYLAKGFLTYLKTMFPDVQIPDTSLIAAPVRSIPYVFSAEDLAKILSMEIADSNLSIKLHTAQTLFALMACTGLRPGEAIRLTIEDVELNESPGLLKVNCSKYGKTRVVPVHQTTVAKLLDYLNWRQKTKPASLKDPFFVSTKGQQVKYQVLRRIFMKVIDKVELRASIGHLPPTLHSLRHTFAVQRVQRWYEEGENANALMPNLAVYLGHAHIDGTYWYLSATPDLMAAAANLFEDYSKTGGVL
ncbi:tyrosine-type recombinase/integrase [soil metagenome]